MRHTSAALPTTLAALALAAGLAQAQNARLDKDRAHAAELLADAGSRASGLSGGGYAGYDRGFRISDAAGDNTLVLGGSTKFRYMANFRSDDPPITGEQDFISGFQFSTARLYTSGSIYNRAITYKVQGNFIQGNFAPGSTGAGDNFALEDAWAQYTLDKGVSVKWGQFKLPFLREEMVEDEFQLAADRSEANEYFTAGYTQGVQIGYQVATWRLWTGFTDGAQSPTRLSPANTSFDSPNEADWALNARAEFMVVGSDFSRFDQFTSFQSSPSFSALLGAAIFYQSFGSTGATTPPPRGEEFGYTLDVTLQGAGWSAFAAFVGNHNEPDLGSDTDDLGFVVQGSFLPTNRVELFGRWDAVILDDASLLVSGTDDTVSFLTLGANYYASPESQALKFTTDVVFGLNESAGLIDPTIGSRRTGIGGDTASGEVLLRVQAQVRY